MKRNRSGDAVSSPKATANDLSSLTLHALRVELSRRKLSVSGSRRQLEARLSKHLTELSSRSTHFRLLPTFVTVPLKFEQSAKLVKCTNSPSTTALAKNKSATKPAKVKATGTLQARSVWICGEETMRLFWEISGPIGKGNLSRSQPCYSAPTIEKGKGRAMRQLLEMNEGTSADNDIHAFDKRQNVEHLQLSLVEAFYAAFALETLTIVSNDEDEDEDNEIMNEVLQSPKETWELFGKRIGPTFAPLLVAYTRYRAAGWQPKSGLKYGVDWVLYPLTGPTSKSKQNDRNNNRNDNPKEKQKPMFRHTHAPYCVLLKFNDSQGLRDVNSTQQGHIEPQLGQLDRTWASLQNRLRLVKNVAKTLVIVDVSFDSMLCGSNMREAFRNVRLTELTIDRWVP